MGFIHDIVDDQIELAQYNGWDRDYQRCSLILQHINKVDGIHIICMHYPNVLALSAPSSVYMIAK